MPAPKTSPPRSPQQAVPPGSFDDSAAGEEDPGAGVDMTPVPPPPGSAGKSPGKPYVAPPDT